MTRTRKRKSRQRRKEARSHIPLTLEPGKPLIAGKKITIRIRGVDRRFLANGKQAD